MITAAIRQKIEARYGMPIRYSKDCEGLSNSINKYCQERISITTLKRLFGFAKNVEQPRLFTLDVLATYIGYTDWSSLLANIENAAHIGGKSDLKEKTELQYNSDIHLLNHQISISLTSQTIDIKKVTALCRQLGNHPQIFPFIIDMMGIAARQKNIRFLKQVFTLPNIFDEKKHSFLQIYYVGQTMGIILRSYPDLSDELIESLATNKKAQLFLIEMFVDEDNLLGYYGKLLDAYHHNKQTELQDRLFYYCLKYSQAVQSGNDIQRKKWYKKIKDLKILPHIHQIPVARYIGICLSEESLHLFHSESPYYKIARQYLFVNVYEHALEFALYLCRELFRSLRTDWLIQIINDFEKHQPKIKKKLKNHLDALSQNELLIYKCFAHILQGNKRKATQYFSNIDPNLFDPFIYQHMHRDYIYVAHQLKIK